MLGGQQCTHESLASANQKAILNLEKRCLSKQTGESIIASSASTYKHDRIH